MKKTWGQTDKIINKNKEKDKILCIKTGNKLQSDPYFRAGYIGAGGHALSSPLPLTHTLFVAKRKKGNKGKKKRVSKQKLLKNCHQEIVCIF